MSLIECADCTSEISDSADACPQCGRVMTDEGGTGGRVVGVVTGLVASVSFLGAMGLLLLAAVNGAEQAGIDFLPLAFAATILFVVFYRISDRY